MRYKVIVLMLTRLVSVRISYMLVNKYALSNGLVTQCDKKIV